MLTHWAMSNSPLWLGGDLTRMDNAALSIVTNPEVIELNQKNKNLSELVVKGHLPVYKKQLDDGSIAVAIYNLGDKTSSITIHFNDLGECEWRKKPIKYVGCSIGLRAEYKIRDLRQRKELGTFNDSWTDKSVVGHGSRLLKFTKA